MMTNIENIIIENHSEHEYIDCIILSAVNFLCDALKISSTDFCLRCIISIDYNTDIKKYHKKPDDDNQSNATFIPSFYQINTQNIPVVIINWKKIGKYPRSFITSVFVHEFSHFYDYKMCHALEEKYGEIFSFHVKEGTVQSIIGGQFSMRTEMRAKYFQEQYECTFSPPFDKTILSRMHQNVTPVKSAIDFINLAYLEGQYLYWHEYDNKFSKQEGYPIAITENLKTLKKRLDSYFEENPESNFLDLFDEESLWKKCDSLYNNR